MKRSTRRVRAALASSLLIFTTAFVYLHASGYTIPFGDGVLSSTAHNALKRDVSDLNDEYDFIVVGGGQSGLTVANRLSEDKKSTVLVIEYGHLYHDDPLITRPWQPFNASANEFHDPKMMYNYTSVPQHALNNRRTPVSAAATVGGGSTVNGMFLNRGSREDYDAWEALGNPGWSWKDLLPYFRRSVTFTPPGEWIQREYGMTYDTEAAYGGNGAVHASNPAWAWPGMKAQIKGWLELGLKMQKEGAGGDAFGIFWVPRAQHPKTQTRSYAVTGHLDRAMERSNFALLEGHRVQRVLLGQDNAAESVVVKARFGEGERVVRARKEVVLAAGLHSPIILQRSGIGPRNLLESANIPVRVDLPGVGANLQDHPAAGISFEYKTDMALNPSNLTQNATFAALQQAEFDTKRTGPFAGGHNAVVFLTASDVTRPSRFLEMVEKQSSSTATELSYLPSVYANSSTLRAGFGAQKELLSRALVSRQSTQAESPVAGDTYALVVLQKPFARGTIYIDPRNPMDGGPLIDFQTMANPIDMEMLLESMKFIRKWSATSAMSVLSPVEQWPNTDFAEKKQAILQSADPSKAHALVPDQGVEDERLRIHIRSNAESGIGHESGTCAMMPLELGGVVGPDLLVHKVRRLSVVDSSIMPLIPSTNLCATVYAVAEKAADLIKARHGGKIDPKFNDLRRA